MQIISIPNNTSYSNLNTLTGYAVGISLILTNNTSQPLFLVQSDSTPTASSTQFPVLSGQTVVVEGSSTPTWIKGSTGPVVVQPVASNIAPYGVYDLPSDVWTSATENVRRLQVDVEETSFQDNRQFRYFESFREVPSGSTVVYKFTTVNPLFILNRKLDIWKGGREYLVYGTTGVSFDEGLLGSPLPIFNVNGVLKEGLSSHPVSQVTIRKAVGVDIFDPLSSLPTNGTLALTDGNSNRATSAYAPAGEKGGVAAGQSFYLVLFNIPTNSNNNTSGQITLLWEEIF